MPAFSTPYNIAPADLRAVLMYYDQLDGMPVLEIADKYSVGTATVYKAIKRGSGMGLGEQEIEKRRGTLRARYIADLERADKEYRRYSAAQLEIDRNLKALRGLKSDLMSTPASGAEEVIQHGRALASLSSSIADQLSERHKLASLMKAANDQSNLCGDRLREIDGLKTTAVTIDGEEAPPHVTISFNGPAGADQDK